MLKTQVFIPQTAEPGLSTEGGSLLLRQADRKIGLLRRVARCFTDYRQPERIEHRLEEMLAQRIYGLALGYEDLNDHEQLRQDPLLRVLAGKRDLSEPLAGKSTLNRLELTPYGSPAAERYNKMLRCVSPHTRSGSAIPRLTPGRTLSLLLGQRSVAEKRTRWIKLCLALRPDR